MPGIDAPLLFLERHEDAVGGCVALHQSEALQRVELLAEPSEVADGLFHCTAYAAEIGVLVAGIGVVAQQVFRVFHLGVFVTQVVHVGIETGATHEECRYTYDGGKANGCQERLVMLEGIAVDAVDEPWERLAPGEQLRQIDQRKERGAEDGEGGKETEVAQEVGLDEDECREGADGGQAS